MYRLYLKRFFDFSVSVLLIIFLIPLFLIVSLVLSLDLKSNPFFVQLRPGKEGKIFKIIKFKTMREMFDTNGDSLPDKDRLTKIGSFIRTSSIDELPQLINVIKGEMSIVGPRPLMPDYLPLYNKRQLKRHDVLPGITGWAQVNGRNDIAWKDKFEMDVWYVENISFLLDLKIIYLSILKVFKKEGVYKNNDITSLKPFNGDN